MAWTPRRQGLLTTLRSQHTHSGCLLVTESRRGLSPVFFLMSVSGIRPQVVFQNHRKIILQAVPLAHCPTTPSTSIKPTEQLSCPGSQENGVGLIPCDEDGVGGAGGLSQAMWKGPMGFWIDEISNQCQTDMV